MWYVYILQCNSNALYTGITIDVAARLRRHRAGRGSAYVRQQGACRIVYVESHDTKSTALKRELAIKGWSRLKKLSLLTTVRN